MWLLLLLCGWPDRRWERLNGRPLERAAVGVLAAARSRDTRAWMVEATSPTQMLAPWSAPWAAPVACRKTSSCGSTQTSYLSSTAHQHRQLLEGRGQRLDELVQSHR